MSKFISTFVIAVAAFSMIISGTVSSYAAVSTGGLPLSVNSTSGLNIRDYQCNIIGKVKDRAVVETYNPQPEGILTCDVNGVTYRYTAISNNASTKLTFVASQFLGGTNSSDVKVDNYITGKAKTTSMLNIRDNNCKKIGSVKAGVTLTTVNNVQGGMTCTVNGTTYTMRSILSNGTVYNVAQKYITE
jgi:hypothetical protein